MRRRADQRLSGPARALVGCGGLLFALFGVLPFWAMFVGPALELGRSFSWATARCEVLYVGTERAGGEYRPLVAYAYQVAGRERISARFEVLPNDYKTEEKARAQATDLTAGRPAECYVSASGVAVLKRRPNTQLYLGLVPLVFLIPAVLFLWLATRPGGRIPRAGDGTTWLPGGARPQDFAEASTRPLTLRPASTPLGRFLALLAATLVWNGLTGAFVAAVWSQGGAGDLPAGMLCFAPFPIVGLLLLAATVQRFLALFGPRASLTLSQPAVRPGESVAVSWELRRMAWRVRTTRVALVGRELVPAGGDGSGTAPAHVFLEHELGQVLPGGSPTEGRAGLTIPAGLMHSFEGGSFKVEWLVRVRAEVLLAPDLEEEFPLLVLPERPRP